MNKDEEYERYFINTFIRVISYFLKWAFFAYAVFKISMTLSLGVFAIIRNSNISIDLLEHTIPFITPFLDSDIVILLDKIGLSRLIIGSLTSGIAQSVSYVILFILTKNFIRLFELINSKEIFSLDTLKIVKSSLPLSVLLTFTQPILICIAMYTTKMYTYENINISGLTILLIFYILEIIFTRAYKLKQESELNSQELANLKINNSEEKIKKIKSETTKSKKTTKKTTKK